MNRAFKIQFHNGEPDEKPIVTMSVRVDNGKRFDNLDADGLKNLHKELYTFTKSVEAFMDEVKERNFSCSNPHNPKHS